MQVSILPKLEKISESNNKIIYKWRNDKFHITYRNQSNCVQLLTKDIHDALFYIKQSLPDAQCLTAITMLDLYPSPKWNFVFGEAQLLKSVGVFSFIRYNPQFYKIHEKSQMIGFFPDSNVELDEDCTMLTRRSCKVMLHEIGHMFGIEHCCYFNCLMNGSNHLDESDSHPLFLCPMDLRKLAHVVGFDPIERYQNLLKFFTKYEGVFGDEKEWLSERLLYIT